MSHPADAATPVRDAPTKRRYRWLDDEFASNGRRRVMVVHHDGQDGFVVRATQPCTGCCEYGDYGTVLLGGYDTKGELRGIGCEECGYTGKRRSEYFIPFSHAEPAHV